MLQIGPQILNIPASSRSQRKQCSVTVSITPKLQRSTDIVQPPRHTFDRLQQYSVIRRRLELLSLQLAALLHHLA